MEQSFKAVINSLSTIHHTNFENTLYSKVNVLLLSSLNEEEFKRCSSIKIDQWFSEYTVCGTLIDTQVVLKLCNLNKMSTHFLSNLSSLELSSSKQNNR
jgi:hypothetical protein